MAAATNARFGDLESTLSSTFSTPKAHYSSAHTTSTTQSGSNLASRQSHVESVQMERLIRVGLK